MRIIYAIVDDIVDNGFWTMNFHVVDETKAKAKAIFKIYCMVAQ